MHWREVNGGGWATCLWPLGGLCLSLATGASGVKGGGSSVSGAVGALFIGLPSGLELLVLRVE